MVPSLAQIAIATPPVRTVFGRYLIECNYDYDHDLLLHLPERKGVARVVPRRCLFFGFSFFFFFGPATWMAVDNCPAFLPFAIKTIPP